MRNWSIPTEQLISHRRTGGSISLSGFNFQAAYACLNLANLLDTNADLIAVRYEGVQDVDLLYADGREKYVQLKNEPNKKYTLAELRPTLQNFAADLLDTGSKETLTFELVARSNSIDRAIAQLLKAAPSTFESDVKAFAEELAKSTESKSAPECLKELTCTERYCLAKQLLQQSTFRFGVGEQLDGQLSFESRAYVVLAQHGVASIDLQSAFDCLNTALTPQRTYYRADVQEILKRFIGGAAIDIFNGRVEALNNELLSHPADAERIKGFYAGEPLGWDIVAAHGDIERDQQEDLIDNLSHPSEKLRLFVLEAEPGAGKSTLARRIAVELHRRHNALVIRVKSREDAATWYLMEDFYNKVKCPFYVLADDLFRVSEVVEALRELNPDLPITILATTRANEYRPYLRLPCEVESKDVRRPSTCEKGRLLERLGKTRAQLTPKQQELLDTDSPFLVLMMEIIEGKKLRDIVADTLDLLRKNSESTYRAYEYCCFAYKHGVAFSESLLERLDERGSFYNLLARHQAKKLIFEDEDRAGTVRVGHPIIAEVASAVYERAPANVLREIVNAVNPSDSLERRFVAHLLRAEAQAKSDALQWALPSIETAIKSCQQTTNRISELTIWRMFYQHLKQYEEVRRCEDIGLSLTPETSFECNMLLSFYRKRGRERSALPIIAEWLQQHPDSHGSRNSYLGLVERYGAEEEREAVINETSVWLKQHPGDTYVRTHYLGLVERKGTPEQVEHVLQETSAWLTKYPGDTYVRTHYLGLVERKGTPEQVEHVLQETSAWLTKYPNNVTVRTRYLGLVEMKGTFRQVDNVLYETSVWLAQNPNTSIVREKYLKLVRYKGEENQVKRALQETVKWLGDKDEDTSVRVAYLRLIEKKAPDKSAQVINETSAWLEQHPDDTAVRACYLGLVERRGTREQVEHVLSEIEKWLQSHDSAKEVWQALIAVLIRLGKTRDAAASALKAISLHPHNRNLTAHYLRLFQNSADVGAVKQLYENLLGDFPNDSRIRTHFAAWLREHDLQDEATPLYESLIKNHPKSFQARYGYGCLLLKVGKFREAAEQFRATLNIRPKHAMALGGLGQSWCGLGVTLEKDGNRQEANRCFLNALKEFNRAIRCAGEQGESQYRHYTSLGWFYIERCLYPRAIKAFQSAIDEDPDSYDSYWGIGRAKFELKIFQEADAALRMALKKAPEDFQPPASEEIPELLALCQAALDQSASTEQ